MYTSTIWIMVLCKVSYSIFSKEDYICNTDNARVPPLEFNSWTWEISHGDYAYPQVEEKETYERNPKEIVLAIPLNTLLNLGAESEIPLVKFHRHTIYKIEPMETTNYVARFTRNGFVTTKTLYMKKEALISFFNLVRNSSSQLLTHFIENPSFYVTELMNNIQFYLCIATNPNPPKFLEFKFPTDESFNVGSMGYTVYQRKCCPGRCLYFCKSDVTLIKFKVSDCDEEEGNPDQMKEISCSTWDQYNF